MARLVLSTLLLLSLLMGVTAGLPVARAADDAPPQDAAQVAPQGEVASQPVPASPASLVRLHPALRRLLDAQQQDSAIPCRPGTECAAQAEPAFIPVIVEWQPGSTALAEAAVSPDRIAHRAAVVAALQADAARQTAALQSTLAAAEAQGLAQHVRTFWVSPVIALDARPELIVSLAQRDDVVQVRPDERFEMERVDFVPAGEPKAQGATLWNLTAVQALAAQQALALDGRGVVVANMDTGVDWQHPALLTKYRGYRGRGPAVHYGNWHVSTDEPYRYPGDGAGHGTHTMGTIVGDDGEGNRTGVAPGAQWIAVKVFANEGYTYESWLHDGYQWLLAPEGDPSLAPDVVNSSWGSDISSDDRFRPDLVAMRAAGILPIFSAGNHGPREATIGSPASLPEAFAVGAADDAKSVAYFSSRGPSPWKETKPEVVAPGVGIVSAFPGGGYRRADGTSMAAPHVAGIAALLLQAHPGLSPDELEAILKTTAEPIGKSRPDAAAGWGLVNAYTAALQVTTSGELVGRVVRADGQGIASATLSLVERDAGRTVSIGASESGEFKLALQPGTYDVTARAFGFEPSVYMGARVQAGSQTAITLTLSLLPAGSVYGRVTDVRSGAPVSATITVDGTPLRVATARDSGLYALALPTGDYSITVTADAHRIVHLPVSVVAGTGQERDVALDRAPRILLVDSGRWYYGSRISYFEDALDALSLPYVLWPIRSPSVYWGGVDDRPTATTLRAYDVVIWSAPQDSPGYIESGPTLQDYMSRGGRVLLSGQDIAYWDGGGSVSTAAAPYLYSLMGFWFRREIEPVDLAAPPNSPLAPLDLKMNTPDSGGQQYTPDTAQITDTRLARPALMTPGGDIAAIVAGVCRAWRAAWLGFGLDGTGPRAERIAALDRLLAWMDTSAAAYGIVLDASTDTLIGPAGTTVAQSARLRSAGVRSDNITLSIEKGPWPIRVKLPDGRVVSDDTIFNLAACGDTTLAAAVDIPAGLPRDASALYRLRLTSANLPSATARFTITVKTPASLLLVDDERWYNHEDRYIRSLDDLGMSYDVYSTRGSTRPPAADMLKWYPMIVWTTGYDWYEPLSQSDETRLASYLDGGGRLLLSSQDLLDVRRLSPFVRDRLGVVGATLAVTPTEVMPAAGGPLDTVAGGLGTFRLDFPFNDWGDALVPGHSTQAALVDQDLYPVAVMHAEGDWRTAFFAFPLETLDDAARRQVVSRTTLWLSRLARSRLDAPAVAPVGGSVPITLTLGLSDPAATADGVQVRLPLPAGVMPSPGSLAVPWRYDPATHSLRWSGKLQPGAPLLFIAALDLPPALAAGAQVPLAAQLSAGDGITVTAEAAIAVGAPRVTLSQQLAPGLISTDGVVTLTATVANTGAVAVTIVYTDTLPAGVVEMPGSAQASGGALAEAPGVLRWTGNLQPGEQASITFQVRFANRQAGRRYVLYSEATDGTGRRVTAGSLLTVQSKVYLPVIVRGAG
jgi:uncharacterized repeat protein (TIGR01451 family)